MKTLIFLTFFLLKLLYAQDFSGYDAYDDSVSAAKKMVLQTQKIDTLEKDTTCTRQADSIKIDSFEVVISNFDSTWNACERLRGNDSTRDRIAALKFYLCKFVMTKKEVEKCAQICLDRKQTEFDGTQYLIDHKCGSEQVIANAHLRKVQMELKMISDYIYELNDTKIHLQSDQEINNRNSSIKPVKFQ